MILLPDAWDFVEHWCDPPEDYGMRVTFQGDVFKGLRLARGITQAQAASWFGVSRRTICDWELGRFVPGRCHLKRICVKFACPYWCLVVPWRMKPITHREMEQMKKEVRDAEG